MANTYVQSIKFHKDLDQKAVIESKSAFLLDDSMKAEFQGNGEVRIFDEVTDGLGSFAESTGYPTGAVTLTSTTYTLDMDRATKFKLDKTKVAHTGIDNYAPGIMGRFIKNHVAPEIDAYMFSKAYSIASAQTGHVVSGTNAAAFLNKSFSILQGLINGCQDIVGDGEELVALCDSNFYADLMATTELTRRLNIGDFKKGEVSTKVKKLDEVGIIKVPSARMKTQYDFNDGSTKFGFAAKSSAENIGCIVLPKKGTLRLVKELEKPKVFTPDTDDDGDNWRILYHLIFGGICKKSCRENIFAYKYGNTTQTTPSNPSGT